MLASSKVQIYLECFLKSFSHYYLVVPFAWTWNVQNIGHEASAVSALNVLLLKYVSSDRNWHSPTHPLTWATIIPVEREQILLCWFHWWAEICFLLTLYLSLFLQHHCLSKSTCQCRVYILSLYSGSDCVHDILAQRGIYCCQNFRSVMCC